MARQLDRQEIVLLEGGLRAHRPCVTERLRGGLDRPVRSQPTLELEAKGSRPAVQIGDSADEERGILGTSQVRTYDVWQDSAEFHFLTDGADREAYRRALLAGLAPGGLAIIATFAPTVPKGAAGSPSSAGPAPCRFMSPH